MGESRRAPALFVSFPSLKDPARRASSQRHTAELVAWSDWGAFEYWADTRWGKRPDDYRSLRDSLEHTLRVQFEERFPGLASPIRVSELSTPLSTLHFTGHERGAVYGVDPTPERFAARALDIRTSVPGPAAHRPGRGDAGRRRRPDRRTPVSGRGGSKGVREIAAVAAGRTPFDPTRPSVDFRCRCDVQAKRTMMRVH